MRGKCMACGDEVIVMRPEDMPPGDGDLMEGFIHFRCVDDWNLMSDDRRAAAIRQWQGTRP